jgi:hypothetical protein
VCVYILHVSDMRLRLKQSEASDGWEHASLLVASSRAKAVAHLVSRVFEGDTKGDSQVEFECSGLICSAGPEQ